MELLPGQYQAILKRFAVLWPLSILAYARLPRRVPFLSSPMPKVVSRVAIWMSGVVCWPIFVDSCLPQEATISSTKAVIVVDGVATVDLKAAILKCPRTGCLIDMRSGRGSHALGAVDPIAPTIIELGPFNDYTIEQFTLESNEQIIGSGASATIIRSDNAALPVFVLNGRDMPTQDLFFRGFRIVGASQNLYQDAFFLDCSTTKNAGLWYSTFEDLRIEQFMGNGIHLRCRPNDGLSAHQFLQFRNIAAKKPLGASSDLLIEGSVGNIQFSGGLLDGYKKGDGTNILIEAFGKGTFNPYSISFRDVTCQYANICAHLEGAQDIHFQAMHHEELNGGYLFTLGGSQNRAIVVSDTYFAGNVGTNGENGYLFRTEGSGNKLSLHVQDCTWSSPDHVLIGRNDLDSLQTVIFTNNFGQSSTSSTGVVQKLMTSVTLDVGTRKIISASGSVPVLNLQSGLMPGETLILIAGGRVTLLGQGNINLGGRPRLVLSEGQTAAFTLNDLNHQYVLLYTSGSLVDK